MTDELRPYQREGVAFLAERDSALLADEMGLGKTVQAAVALTEILASGRRRALIVAPSSLKLNWHRELRRWAPSLSTRVVQGSRADRAAYYALPVPVLITSYENLRIDARHFPSDLMFEVSILDEAQRIKNPDSSTALGARLIPRKRSWALTGTPVENSPQDLQSIFAFVRPQTLAPGMNRVETLRAIDGYVLRRNKSDVLRELPPIIVQDVPLELTGAQLRAYQELWGERTSIDRRSPTWASNALTLLTRLKQACNFDAASGESTKLDMLQLICEGLGPSGKVIVFSQYVETLEFVSGRLGVPTLLFHGGMDEQSRDATLQQFREADGPLALLMSLRAGGVGLNLQEASAVVLFDRWWNPALEEQALNRAHRFGRTAPLHVFRFLVEDTVEERIEAVLQRKRAIVRDYVDASVWQPEVPSRDELRDVLR